MFRIYSDSQITLAGSGTTTLNFGQPISISGTLYGTTLSINTTSFMNDIRSNDTVSVGGSEFISGNVSVNGSEFISGNVSVSGILYNNGQVSISGPTTLQNTVSVSGHATFQNSVSISGLAVLQDRLSVAHTIFTDRNLSVSGIIYANHIQSAVYNPSNSVDGSGVGSYVLNIGMNDGPNTINIGQPGDIVNIGGSKTIVNATEVQLSVSGTIFGTQLSLQNNAFIQGNVSVIGNLQTTGTTNLSSAVLSGNLTVNGTSNNTIAGTNTFSGSTALGSELHIAPLTVSTITSNTINVTTYSMVRLTASGVITTINTSSPIAGYNKVLTIVNASSGTITFQNGASTYNISTPSKNDVVIPVGGSIQLTLDLTSSPYLWYITAVGGDGASNMNRLRTNATTIASGVGSFATYNSGAYTNMYLPLNATNTALQNGMFIINTVLPNNNRIDSVTYGTSTTITPSNGDILLLQNASSSTIVIYDYSSSSPTGLPTNAFKIITGTSSPLTLAKNSTVILSYNSTTSAWYITGGSGSGSGGSKKQWYQATADLTSINSAGQTLVTQPLAQLGLSIGLPLTVVNTTANSVANGGLPGSYGISDATSSANAEVVGVLSNVLDTTGGLVEITLGGEVTGIPRFYIRELSGTTPVTSFTNSLIGRPVFLNSSLSVQYGATSYVNDVFPTYIVPRYTITDPSSAGTAYATGIVFKPVGVISSVNTSTNTFNMILYNERANSAGQNNVTRIQLSSTNGVTSNVVQLANFDSGKIMGNVQLTNTGFSGYPYNSRFYLESDFCRTSNGTYQATWQTSGDNSGGFALSISGTFMHTIVGTPLSISGPSFFSYSMSGMTIGSQSAVAALSVPLTSDAMRFNYIAPNTNSGMRFMNYNANLSLATTLLTLDNNGNLGIGTSNPPSRLTVAGSVMLPNLESELFMYFINASNHAKIRSETTGDISFWTGTSGVSEKMRIDTGSIQIKSPVYISGNFSTQDTLYFIGSIMSNYFTSAGGPQNILSSSFSTFFIPKSYSQVGSGSAANHGVLRIQGPVASAYVEITSNGSLTITNTLSKAAGSFVIPHPDPIKKEQGYKLRHCFVESPTRGDNLYRFTVQTVNKTAVISLPDYYHHLNENTQIWVSQVCDENTTVFGSGGGYVNPSNSQEVKIRVSEDGNYNVLIIGTRKDPAAKNWFDEKGVEYIDS